MKKNYLLLSAFVLSTAFAFAQNSVDILFEEVQHKKFTEFLDRKQEKYKPKVFDKVYKDTLFYEDFADSIPAGWTTFDANNGNFTWRWDDQGPGSGGSTAFDPLESTTSDNGFLSLPMTEYNAGTPNELTMDAWITSPAIALQPKESVYLIFQQSLFWCCSPSAVEIVAEVSTDSLNWDTYEMETLINTRSDNGEVVRIDVSKTLTNQDTAFLRFRVEGAVAYYWMIDDVALIEGPKNAIELESFFVKYHDPLTFTPNYTRIPYSQVDSTLFLGFLRNGGANAQSNVSFNVDITHDSTLSGGPGSGNVYSNNQVFSNLPSIFNTRDTAEVSTPQFIAPERGYYTFSYSVTSDSLNQFDDDTLSNNDTAVVFESNEMSSRLIVTEDQYAWDNSRITGLIGPYTFANSGGEGDRTMLLLNVKDTLAIRSISVYVPGTVGDNPNSHIGASLSPRVYKFDETVTNQQGQLDLNAAITTSPAAAFSPFSETVTQDDINSWLTLAFPEPVNLEPGTYYVGVEQTNSVDMIFARDGTAEEPLHGDFGANLTSLYFLSGSNSWATSSKARIPIIRVNVSDSLVSVPKYDLSNESFNVLPNPSNGQIKIELENDVKSSEAFQLNVRNMLGQNVYNERVVVNGHLNKQLNLNDLESGVYFISLENDKRKLLKKIIIK